MAIIGGIYRRHLSAIAEQRKEKNGKPTGARTQDPLIKSQMLYRLSYRLTINWVEKSRQQVAEANEQGALCQKEV